VKPEQEIHARHILVATEDEAKEIAERLKKGEDFATLAKEKSKDANADGGDLGWFGRGQMLKPFEDAAFALDVGQIAEPVQTQFVWHIIKVEEKRDQPLPTSIRSRKPSSGSCA
jgi:peptidyl-prolyl cis-trans isomerase C